MRVLRLPGETSGKFHKRPHTSNGSLPPQQLLSIRLKGLWLNQQLSSHCLSVNSTLVCCLIMLGILHV